MKALPACIAATQPLDAHMGLHHHVLAGALAGIAVPALFGVLLVEVATTRLALPVQAIVTRGHCPGKDELLQG